MTLSELYQIIEARVSSQDSSSYSKKLFEGPINRLAQKIGEEGVEVALAAMLEDKTAIIAETCDLLYHLLVLLLKNNINLDEIESELTQRNQKQ